MISKQTIKIAAITIGQTPRIDIMKDLYPLLPSHIEFCEYGALDDYNYDEIIENLPIIEGKEILVSRMRDGRQVKFGQPHIIPLIQKKIDEAQKDGCQAIILFCTGEFPDFKHQCILVKPQPLFHSIVKQLSGHRKIGVMVPDAEQEQQAHELWGSTGIEIETAIASPYLQLSAIETAAKHFKNQDISFICLDCMGYTLEMKHLVQKTSGIPVLLPRTLVTQIIKELYI